MRLLISFAKKATHPHPHQPPNVDKRHINVSVPKTIFCHPSLSLFLTELSLEMLHIFFIVYSCSTFRPSDHAYCQLYQFNMLTFQPIWQFHSMESNRSSSSINSYTFSSIGSITSIDLIETICSIISMPSVQPFKSVLHSLFHFHWYYQFQQFY